MGTFRVDFTIRNRNTGQSRDLNGLVDTGASFTVIPMEILDELGIERDETDLFSLADGSVQELALGRAEMLLQGRYQRCVSSYSEPAVRKSCSEPWRWKPLPSPPTPKTNASSAPN